MQQNALPPKRRDVAASYEKFLHPLRFIPIFPRSGAGAVPMRKTFLVWLLVYTAAAFCASFAVSFYFEGRSARREAERTIELKIREAIGQAARARENLANAIECERQTTLGRARAAALILEGSPEFLTRPDGPEQLAKTLLLDEIDVVDENGVCVAGWPSYCLGFDFRTPGPTREFLQILDDPSLEIAQPIREAAQKTGLFQYSAVARRDAPGFVEVGVRTKSVEKARELADLARYIGSFRVGQNGFLLVFQNGVLLNADGPRVDLSDYPEIPVGKSLSFRVDGRSFFAIALEDDGALYLGALPQSEAFAPRRVGLVLLIGANFLLFLVVFALTSALVQTLVVDGVYSINRSLEKITNGDLEERIEERATKEFDELSTGINATVDALKGAISEVKRRVAEELDLARKIQSESLPSVSPELSARREFDIFAENRPESSVGGDMYDFFFVDADRFVFYVADVSGHGVPAALFMMKTMALVKNLARSGLDLAEIVTQTNRYLTENNESMFVTGFFCELETSTGRLTYVDAGHNPPVARRKNGAFYEIAPEINLLLGVDADVRYESATFALAPGDSLLLFTDGVTEAESSATSEQFGVARLLDALNAVASTESARTVVATVFNAVEKFAAGAERSDDVTVLCLRYDGPAPR